MWPCGGVLTDGKDMADQNQSSVYVPAVQQLFYLADVICIWTNQSDKDCFASDCPQNVNLPFEFPLQLFLKQKLKFITFWKQKSIQPSSHVTMPKCGP